MTLVTNDLQPHTLVSFVIPVYNNYDSLAAVLRRLVELQNKLPIEVEAVFVIDGSPDDSHAYLATMLPMVPFQSKLLRHSRNFGSFAGISSGLAVSTGDLVAIMSADLQEPESLYVEAINLLLVEDIEVVIAARVGRQDGKVSTKLSNLFWGLYRRLIQSEMPRGGVDVFVVKRNVAEVMTTLGESRSTLIGLLIWLGYKRRAIPYLRQSRQFGESAWTLRKKLKYAIDSAYAFSDLPAKILTFIGIVSVMVTVPTTTIIFIARVTGQIEAVGYTPLILAILSMFSILILAMGILTSLVWRIFENSKFRPKAVVADQTSFSGARK